MVKEDKLINYLTSEEVVKEVERYLGEENFYYKEMGNLHRNSIWENKVDTNNGVRYELKDWMKPIEDFYKEKGIKVLYDNLKTNREMKFNIGFKVDERTEEGLALKEEGNKYVQRELESYLDILKTGVEDMTSPEMVEYIEGYVEVSYENYEVKLLSTIPKRILMGVDREVKKLQQYWDHKGLEMEYSYEGEEGSIFYDLRVEVKEKSSYK